MPSPSTDLLRPDTTDAADEAPARARICTTSEAARLLGVSNTTVQIMVERGELQAWKTRGGHRRINLDAVESIRRARGLRDPASATGATVNVLVADDDPTLRVLLESALDTWGLPLNVTTAADGMEALLLIERSRPDLLITDLHMRPMDGFELLRMLRARREFDAMAVIVLTALDDSELAQRGGLPRGVAVYHKPVQIERLRGFVEAHVLRKQLAGG